MEADNTGSMMARIQAGFNELRYQREMLADRCANMAQEIAERDIRIHELEEAVQNLSQTNECTQSG